jgi:hypothetical protein
MLEQARKAANEEAKAGFLDLAESWRDMAEKLEAAAKRQTRQ